MVITVAILTAISVALSVKSQNDKPTKKEPTIMPIDVCELIILLFTIIIIIIFNFCCYI